MPRIISQKLKITEFETRDGVVVRKEIIPSVIGFVALWTMFCINPAIASRSTWVSPFEGVFGTIGFKFI